MNIIKINNLNIFKFDLPLKKGFVLKDTLIDSRKGIFIEIKTDQGLKYYGESSPLIHFHKEKFSDCLKQIKEIRKIMTENLDFFDIRYLHLDKRYLMDSFEDFFTINFLNKINSYLESGIKKDMLPSVRYCFEMAYFSIFIRNFDFIGQFKISADSFIPLCRLATDVSVTDLGILEEEIRSRKYNTIKIKIGRHETDSEISAIMKIIDIIERNNRKDVAIRLDSNMALSKNEAIRFLKNIDKTHIDFIEDPVRDTSLYQELFEKTGVGVAVDETVKDFIDFNKLSFKKNTGKFLKAIIIKPQVIGGFIDSYKLMKMAESLKIKTVVSNIFETSLSISAISIFIYLINKTEIAAGLDTADSFQKDPGSIKIKSDVAKISIHDAYKNLFKADYSVLQKVF